MRRSLEEPNSLRASAPIMSSSPQEMRSEAQRLSTRVQPLMLRSRTDLVAAHCVRVQPVRTREMPHSIELPLSEWRLRPDYPGLSRHRRGSHACELAIAAHVIVKY